MMFGGGLRRESLEVVKQVLVTVRKPMNTWRVCAFANVNQRSYGRLIDGLRDGGFLSVQQVRNSKMLRITEKGRRLLRAIQDLESLINPDGKME